MGDDVAFLQYVEVDIVYNNEGGVFMLKLSRTNFEKAKDFVFADAADIDRAWYKYNFENHDNKEFIDVLSQYQFENGGFGGLEHEFTYRGPCLKSTEHAFVYLYFLKQKPPVNHPVIKKMMQYVLERYRPELGEWGQLLEPGVNDGTHVWWWTWEPETRSYESFDERILHYNPNGQAALAAFVALYSELVPEKLYQDIIRYPIEKILRFYDKASPQFGKSSTDSTQMEDYKIPYNLKCLHQFCDCLQDKPLAEKLKSILCQNATACMELDVSLWNDGYHEFASDVVVTPESFLYPVVKEEVDKALDALILHQGKDGGWHLPYHFGEEDSFRTLEKAYEAHCTMMYLAELGRFNRIECD